MKKKHNSKKQNRKKLILGLSIILLILIIIAILLSQGKKKEEAPVAKDEIMLNDSLKIVQIGEYNGPYLEDGSNEEVSDVQMIVLENTAEQDLQYAEVILEYENVIAEYAVTNLPAGQKALILEKNRMEFTKKSLKKAVLTNVVFLEEMPLYEDIFEINGLDGVINVKNISNNDISGDIYIYYKNIGEEMYLGGITYRVKIEAGLKSGEIRQLGASHFNAQNCEILMISYVE